MHENSCVIIFIKNLIEGGVKTRLAKDVGGRIAMIMYQDMVAHCLEEAERSKIPYLLAFSDAIPDSYLGKMAFKQDGKDLGERMLNAFNFAFKRGYKKVCLIGSDCMELQSKDLITSLKMLNKKDVVLGPTKDGGYYLVALNTAHPFLFLNKSWSHSGVLKNSILSIQNNGLSYALLDVKNDIDNITDLPKQLTHYLRDA